MLGYKYILIAFHLNFDLNGHEYIFIQSHSEATFYICCLHSKKNHQKFFHFLFLSLDMLGFFISFFFFANPSGIGDIGIQSPEYGFIFFFVQYSLLFSNFQLSFGHPFFPLLFTNFILSIYNSLSDPFNYFLPIPLPLLLSLLTFCVRPSLLPRINGLILLLKQMSIRAQ